MGVFLSVVLILLSIVVIVAILLHPSEAGFGGFANPKNIHKSQKLQPITKFVYAIFAVIILLVVGLTWIINPNSGDVGAKIQQQITQQPSQSDTNLPK